MKKIILLIAAITLTTGVYAQGWWDFGVKAGLNLANVTDSDLDAKASIYVGAFAEYRLSEFFGIQPELVYSRQGGVVKVNDVKFQSRLNYLNLPILAKLYVLEGLSVDLGPQFGLLLNAKDVADNDVSVDLDNMQSLDVSFAMGLSYRIAPRFDVSARYNLGLTKVRKHTDNKNSVFQFGLGYRF